MASEYLKWLARDEQPETPRELTKQERRANWWYYNKWKVLAGLIAVLAVGSIFRDVIHNKKTAPDCEIGYVGSYRLTDETVAALESSLAGLIGDLDGNGTATVRVNQYIFPPENGEQVQEDLSQQMLLTTHVAACINSMYLLEDPAGFQTRFGILCDPDGNQGADAQTLWYRWGDCEALTSLPLGASGAGDHQELLADLYIARTFLGNSPSGEADQRCTDAWKAMIPQGGTQEAPDV